ncbi:pantetheine-phosphate adenylyltransferase [Carnobacterium maltaromaticum]|uniref:pantetheine-phosphate adenylyltransferase n=1 Tax=Carnobacterium maltaromaticum TaxID=2751 RepID=UPI000C77E5A3|nr:pantetheine-phosphate adenylyltransferase [Carnobacterium maltaromaticum]PLS38245.1 pantetheine-phosphate adenylyltransferase [Carnobacterium maltaromaticum]PLS38622.1 pantetheine-phosphate adenylyltransferase [Carnobacterium maltaromaticum]PLS38999.1 pantetheine-phosphate adenylyltransferase [Carnobacterium maltaromaticum]PLS45269.1 pantetheine-phosphate adenylyltransferase [Carnobacterium maltaromaticum]PLS48124.1 pantetheine-phosphate adenylyltransferase [Carnobacterium maltaromaticum]
MNKKALFPGSFDPLTNGHVDTIQRAAKLFDEVIIAVLTNTSKVSLFNSNEKIDLIEKSLQHVENVKVISHVGGLTIDLAKDLEITAMIRGMRNTLDFEYETNIALMNKQLNEKIETVILLADEKYRFLSSSLIKEVARFGGDISAFVPKVVNEAIKEKYKKLN